jgi:uracil-DNA glycosylase family 4
MVESVGELNREFVRKAQAAQLTTDCLADGNFGSTIAIVCESPGFRETQLKVPLVGGSGRFLWDVMKGFGLHRQHFYITNVVKRQLVETKGGDKRGISRSELVHWNALLQWELSQLPNLKHILVLGDIALQAIVGQNGIDQWRGSVVGDGERDFIIAHNPANIMRKPSLEPIFRLDISKLDMVRRGVWREHNVTPIYDPTPREAVQWCDRMIQEGKPVSFDIEVIANETACVGFANNAHEGMCINFRGLSNNRWSVADEATVRRSIQRVLRHASVQLVAQNGCFDSAWLWYKDRIKTKPLWIDTLLAHHTLHPTWPHNLGFLTAQYTTHPFYKNEKSDWKEGGNIASFWEYNVKDVCITWEVARRIEKDLASQKLWDFYRNHVMRLQPHLIASTVLGNRVDITMRKQLEMEFGTSVDKLSTEFVAAARIATGDDTINPNPNSPQQLGKLFFEQLRLTGKTASTDEANRLAMIENPRTSDAARHMLIVLNKYKEQHKLYSTYITAEIDPDNRMRSDYKQYGTQYVPGRLSSSQTLWGSGMNLQNQPEMLRGMFIADRMMFDD